MEMSYGQKGDLEDDESWQFFWGSKFFAILAEKLDKISRFCHFGTLS